MNWIADNKIALAILGASTGIAGLGACASLAGGGGKEQPPNAVLDCATPDHPQCWTKEERRAWYRGSQGSRLIPEAWLIALEEKDSATLFMDRAYFDRFGYLPADPDEAPAPAADARRKCPRPEPANPRLPIGFARDCRSDEKLVDTRLRWYEGQRDREPWIGLNCAACHTVDIHYANKPIRVDGAPTLADFQDFTNSLREAMVETRKDPSKWQRFADRVVAPRRPGEPDDSRVQADAETLKSEFERLLNHHKQIYAYNETKTTEGYAYGHGRLDAVGYILNKVAFNNRASDQFRGEPTAPVSYPFIWNAHQHDFVQWNGIVPNQRIKLGSRFLDVGAIVRNTSEVIGVFAEVRTREHAGLKGYRSSVDVGNLNAMEVQLRKLTSPAWPAAFGEPDRDKARFGERLFKQHCAGCHAPLGRLDRTTPIKAEMTPIWGDGGLATDPWMACNAYSFQAKSGLLEGTKSEIAGGDPLPAIAPTRAFLKTQAIGVLLRQKFKIIWLAVLAAIGKEKEIEVFAQESALEVRVLDQPDSPEKRLAQCIAAADSPTAPSEDLRILAYKARPLNGIWATAPYLHNGSVKSLDELLLEPAKRDKRFWVGNREFDPTHVGYVDRETRYGSWFSTVDSAGKEIPGNSNLGHDYGNRIFSESKEKRMALVEYMKTL